VGLGRHWQYLRYVVVHKYWVFLAGWELGVPWLALLHDNSKFRSDEWGPYARHFYEPDGSKKTRRAADGFYRDQANDTQFDCAWLKHIRRNKHHPQHYIRLIHTPCRISDHTMTLFEDDGTVKCLDCYTQGYDWKFDRSAAEYVVDEMPLRYRREMLADWIGAGMAQGTPDTLGWYAARGRHHVFGPKTRAWIEDQLGYRP
jgi:hypothetical protein